MRTTLGHGFDFPMGNLEIYTILALFCTLIVICVFVYGCPRLFWAAAVGRGVGAQNPESAGCCFHGTSGAFQMLWSSISAFFPSYYHLQSRPECRDLDLGRFRRLDVGWIRFSTLKRMSDGSFQHSERPGS